jgi:tRNA (guanine37-N1)-methyltransferase
MSLKGDLSDIIPPDKLHLLGDYEMIGDAAVISLQPGLDAYKKDAAGAIVSKRRNIRTVLHKISKVKGERRVSCYEVLHGTDTIVTYKEYGFTYKFDITNVFFNPRLKYERHRLAGLVLPGEKVLIPFAGAGPFAVPIAAKGCRVFAVEKNADACRWMALNARLNSVEDRIDILNADVRALPGLQKTVFDRAIVPAPYGMDVALELITPMVGAGGTIHFYTFKKKYQIEGLVDKYLAMGLNIDCIRRCGNVAPGVSRWAFDLIKQEL